MYAIVQFGNKQFQVEKDTRFSIDRVKGKPGDEIVASQVLLIGNGNAPKVGCPTVPNAKVLCEVTRHYRGEKRVAYKFRRRKNSQMKKGFRAELTELRVKEIVA